MSHELTKTLHIDIMVPDGPKRVETALYRRSRGDLIEREGGRCWACGRTEEETGHPIEAHHHPIERSLAPKIDYERLAKRCKEGWHGPYAQQFDWEKFFADAKRVKIHVGEPGDLRVVEFLAPQDIYMFVDDMRVNGRLLCFDHHRGVDSSEHETTEPLFMGEVYIVNGFKFSPNEIICHEGSSG